MRRDQFEQLHKMEHFSDPENEYPIDSLRKLKIFLKYLIAHCKGNYTSEEHLVTDKYASIWKGRD